MDNDQTLGSTDPRYVSWLGEVLTRLALSRMEGWVIEEQPLDGHFDFGVVTDTGKRFLIEVKAGSSLRGRFSDMATADNVRYRLDKRVLERASSQEQPTVLFLFDVDTEAGRYLILKDFDSKGDSASSPVVSLPKSNLISTSALKQLAVDL